MSKHKPKFRVGRKLADADATTFEERQEQRAQGVVNADSLPRGLGDMALSSGAVVTAADGTASHVAETSVSQVPNGANVPLGELAVSGTRGLESAPSPGSAVLKDLKTEVAQGVRGPTSTDGYGAPLAADASPTRRDRGGWTKSSPYTRKDGVATRSTTIYLPVELADRLRRFAFEADRKQSDVVAEALELLLARDSSAS